MEYLCVGIYLSRTALCGESARMKLRLSCRTLDLKYQQSELDFCAKPEAKVIKLLCYSANCLCIGRVTVCGSILSHFWRE